MKLELCKNIFTFELLPSITICGFSGQRISSISLNWLNYAIQLKL